MSRKAELERNLSCPIAPMPILDNQKSRKKGNVNKPLVLLRQDPTKSVQSTLLKFLWVVPGSYIFFFFLEYAHETLLKPSQDHEQAQLAIILTLQGSPRLLQIVWFPSKESHISTTQNKGRHID